MSLSMNEEKSRSLNVYSNNSDEENIEVKKSNISNLQNQNSNITLNENATPDFKKGILNKDNSSDNDMILPTIPNSSSMSVVLDEDMVSSSSSSSRKHQHSDINYSSLIIQQEPNEKSKNKCNHETVDSMDINNADNGSSYRDCFYDASEYSCNLNELQKNNDEIMEKAYNPDQSLKSSNSNLSRESSYEDINSSFDDDYESCEYSMSDRESNCEYEESSSDDNDDVNNDEEEIEDINAQNENGNEEEIKKNEELQREQQNIRKQIINIQKDTSLTESEKARKIQNLMTVSYNSKKKAQNDNITNYQPTDKVDYDRPLTDEEKAMTYHDKEKNILGCKHYQRALKIQAHCCGKWFPCRFCHDEVSDHSITSKALTVNMMCMYCSTVQPVNDVCINPSCGKRIARYYCSECKLWDNDPNKNIYHCYDCGICRIGKGLGIDYFHCKTCNVCMSISLKGRHKCIERNLESNCPICGEYMFTSTTTVIFMLCGHCIHHKCYKEYIQTSYQCPTCFKSLANMTEYFKRIDKLLEKQKMPEEYKDWKSYILCNDCEKKSYAKFHFIYHKCTYCSSYNTKLIKTLDAVEAAALPSDVNNK